MINITGEKLAFCALVAVLAFWAVPTRANKAAGGLNLNVPSETPDGVRFSWTGGDGETVYSLYRRLRGYDNWELIQSNLQGESGSFFVNGFTLDRDYDYELRAAQ